MSSTPMQERSVAAGAVIFDEGDPGDAVFFIRSGEVEVSKCADDVCVRLVTLGKGEVLGEMSVIRGEPRSTTARAVTETKLMVLEKEQFLAAFGGKGGLALRILRMLCERLANADRMLMAEAGNGAAADPQALRGQVGAIRVLADSDTVRTQIGAEGVVVESLPFRIGRHKQGAKPVDRSPSSLNLRAPNNNQLSPQHFAIQTEGDALILKDLGSQLGTMVNGERISRFDREDSAPLHIGLNMVTAGGADSTYSFIVQLEPKDAAA